MPRPGDVTGQTGSGRSKGDDVAPMLEGDSAENRVADEVAGSVGFPACPRQQGEVTLAGRGQNMVWLAPDGVDESEGLVARRGDHEDAPVRGEP